MYDFDQSEKGMNIKMQKVNKKILLSIIIIWIIFGGNRTGHIFQEKNLIRSWMKYFKGTSGLLTVITVELMK